MQIYEVKNDIADILYAREENELFLSDFLYIEDKEQTVIAQITNISTTEKSEINIATVKFCLSVDKENKLTPFNGHTPSKDSDVGYLEPQEILGLFRPKSREIYWGNYIRDSKIKISTDMNFLSSNACIIYSKADSSKNILKTILNSLNSNAVKSIVLDFDGKYGMINEKTTLTYGKDFRIPLDDIALDYIFNNELDELPIASKAIVQSIILEIEKYMETLPDGFIPFDTFSQIVEEEFKNSNDTGLLIFSNKLAKYRQKKLFANEKSQFDVLNSLKNTSVINISDTDNRFHKLILNSLINRIREKYYIFSDISEENIDNGTIKRIYEKNNIRFIPICSYENKYLASFKQYCSNFVMFAPLTKTNSNEAYQTFINNLTINEFVLFGESTLSIPILVSMKKLIEEIKEYNNAQFQEDVITAEDLDDLDLLTQKQTKTDEKSKQTNNIPVFQNKADEENSTKPVFDFSNEDNHSETTENIIETLFQDRNNKIDLNIKEKKITVVEEEPKHTDIEEKIAGEIEKKAEPAEFTAAVEEKSEETEPENKNIQVIQPVINQQVPVQNKNIPNADELPIYTPKETPAQKETVKLEAGNRVSHAKYGVGIVEKIMNYGKKTLCCIQFEDTGRKLLDPELTSIEKIL